LKPIDKEDIYAIFDALMIEADDEGYRSGKAIKKELIDGISKGIGENVEKRISLAVRRAIREEIGKITGEIMETMGDSVKASELKELEKSSEPLEFEKVEKAEE
jgi:hypothetical protein